MSDPVNFVIFGILLLAGVWGLAYWAYRSDKPSKKPRNGDR